MIVPAGSSASPSALNRVTKIIKMKVVDKKDRFRQWDCEKEEEKKDDQRKTIKSGELFDESEFEEIRTVDMYCLWSMNIVDNDSGWG